MRINGKWIKTPIKTRPRNWLNMDKFINVTISNQIANETTSTTGIARLNTRSAKNINQSITEEVNNKKFDIAVLTERWLKDNTEDQVWLNQSDFKQGNCDTLTHNRPSDKKGGEIATTYRKQYKIIQWDKGHMWTIEYAIWKVIIRNKLVHILGTVSSTSYCKR